jgi:hypothetical protein
MKQQATPSIAILYWNSMVGAFSASESLEDLVSNGVSALGHDVEASRMLFSTNHALGFESAIWSRTFPINTQRSWYEAKTGDLTPHVSLESALEAIEDAVFPDGWDIREHRVVLFVAEIQTRPTPRSPESLLARIWNECLGPTAIPFDPADRQALIAKGCNHPELKRHIEAWRKMRQ